MRIDVAKLRLYSLIAEIETVKKVSDSKFINAEHILSELRLIKKDLEN